MIWKVTYADVYSRELTELLAAGWEPFSAVATADWKVVFLRKAVAGE